MRNLLFFAILLLASSAFAQGSNPIVTYVANAPAGTCVNGPPAQIVTSTGALYTCQALTWTQIAAGVTDGFPIVIGVTSIEGGSNTTAITGLTLDGVSPTTFGYVDATSSIQTQLNGKQASLGFTPAHSGANSDITSLSGLTTPVSVAQGGTGTGSTLTGLMRGSASAMTAAELSGDCITSGSNATVCTKTNGTALGALATLGAGTGVASSGGNLNSNAVYQVSFQPGLVASVTNTISVFSKVSKATTVDNLTGSASTLSCVSNPTITMYECGVSATCVSPTTIGSVTVTAAGTATAGTVSNPAITAGDWVGFAISAGTCTSLDIAGTAQVHSN